MANQPSPVLRATGTAREINVFELTDEATGETRQAARVQVLTERGGFVEVYVPGDLFSDALPGLDLDNLTGFTSRDIDWYVGVRAFQRALFGQDDVPPADRKRYAVLSVRFVGSAADTVATAPARRAVADIAA